MSSFTGTLFTLKDLTLSVFTSDRIILRSGRIFSLLYKDTVPAFAISFRYAGYYEMMIFQYLIPLPLYLRGVDFLAWK